MAVGKSTIGPRVARRLGLPFVDLDAAVVERAGRSIARIFADDGEDGFRALERDALAAALAETPRVIALGGGTLHQPDCLALLAGHTVRVLDVPWAELEGRLTSAERPLADRAASLFETRAEGYAAAGPRVAIGGLDVESATDRVVASLGGS